MMENRKREKKNKMLKLASGFLFAVLICLNFCSGAGSRGAVGGLVYSPGGNGFNYKSTAVPSGDFEEWVKNNKSKIQKAIKALGRGSVLQVVGHTDSSGPRNAVGGRKGNIWYSTQRAKAVYSSLVRSGFSRSKLRFKGIADDELLDSLEPTGQINRRVSFSVVSK